MAIFDKTDKGREEIATRKYRLPPRMRTLLLLIDGRHDTNVLLLQLAGLGLGPESVEQLQQDGFIHAQAGGEPAGVTPAALSSEAPAVPDSEANDAVPPTGQTQFEALYNFYTETIRSTIGLRGYGLQTKVEKAGTVEELRALREDYLEAVSKAQGDEMAHSLRDRLDQLLHADEKQPGAS